MYHVKAFFEAYPKAKEGFETYDGVIHATQAIADKWVERHANKKVTRHANPALQEKPKGEGAGSTNAPKPKKPGGGKPSTGKPTGGTAVAVVPPAAQGPGNTQEGGGDPASGTPATSGDNQ